MDLMWQIFLFVIAAVVFCQVVLKIYVESLKGRCSSKVDLAGKTVIVTGANTGIGFCTALDLARRNARVILACRNVEKGEAAVQDIVMKTGNKDVVMMQLDLSLMKSVRQFVKSFLERETRLDILVNNAGMLGFPVTMTEEGLEATYAANYFGPFLLTVLLLDVLKNSQPSRIINLSSLAHNWSKGIAFDNLKAEKGYSADEELYYDSKLANVLFTRELATRLEGTGVTTYSIHPGCVKSQLLRSIPSVVRVGIAITTYFLFKTAEEGAQTSIYCAVSEDIAGESGKYFVDCKEADNQSSEASRDMGVAKKLWEISEKYTRIAE